MTDFALHTLLLLLVALLAGCIVGCLLRLAFGRHRTALPADAREPRDAAPATRASAAGTAARLSPATAAPPPAGGAVAASAGPDDLKQIKGIGPAIERKLHDLGVTRFAQIAGWTREDVERIDSQLDFRGRVDREDWIAQARELAKSGP